MDDRRKQQQQQDLIRLEGGVGSAAREAVLVAYSWVWVNVDRLAAWLGYDPGGGGMGVLVVVVCC